MRKFEVLKTYSELAWAGYKEFDTKDATQEQKNVFNSKFETIKSSPENSSSGFQAKLFKDKSTGDYILSVRGTEFNPFSNPKETYKDVLEADGDLAFNNTPSSQVGDMVKFINELTKKEDEHGNAITPIIKQEDNIAIVGHSLGGTLAQVASKMYPGLFDKCYTFNSPSGKDLYSKNVHKNVGEKYFWIEDDQIKYLDDNIGKAFYNYQNSPMTTPVTDVRAKDFISPIANLHGGERFGELIKVSGETHFITPMTKILYFYDFAISHGISEEFVTNYLSGYYKNIVSSIVSKSIADIAEKIIQDIDKTIGKAIGKSDIIDICQIYDTDKADFTLELIPFNASINQIFPDSNISIEKLYALVNLNNFIISDIDIPVYKELEKYKDEYSDDYIEDKAKMFEAALKYPDKKPVNFNYFDIETKKELYSNPAGNSDKGTDVIFGVNLDETIQARPNFNNRIYALAGNDSIKGGKHDNYIEAGSGNDTIDLRSSKGENTVYGGVNNGKDNDDDGDDTIYAGQGKDTIYGGTGFDTYYVGDKDVIFDSDGKGKVVFEGVELKGGTYDKDKGAYVSKDGLIEYRLNESGGKSTLTVQKGGKSITINEFNKEDKSLGIKLANSKVEVSVTNKEGGDRWLQESLGDRGLPFTLSLNRKLDKGEYLKVEVVTSMKGDKSIIEFKEGEGDIGKDFNFTWEDDNDPQGNRYFAVNASVVDESSDLTAEVISSARGMIKDDDRDPDNPNRPNNPDVPTDPNDPQNVPVYHDPIIIDLNKDGTTTSKLNGAVNFDIDNNGFKEATGWISKDDAFLAYDRNGNGKIDNGNELFGDKTVSVGAYGYTGEAAKNGFEALKAFDFNNDNIIDEKDKDFDKLLLWQDLNTNGLTEEGELKSLKEHNVKSIDLRYKETQIDNNGNLIKQTSTVTFNDNTTTTADDVWFKVDLRYTEQPSIYIPERIKALPEVTAFGNLHNLRSAMSENSGLENMIKDYISLAPEEKAKQLDNVLFKWAGVEGVDKDSRGQFIDARMLGAYEKISGKPFLQWGNSPNPSLPAANIIMGIMNKFKNYVSANIELQTKYKGLIDTTYMYYSDDTNKYDYDFSKVNAKLKDFYNAKNYKELSLLSGTVRDAAQYKSELLDSFKNNLEKLASNNDDLALFALSDYISGTDKDDVIRGKSSHNLFIGGKGNDVFQVGYGKNTYIYHKGDGNDTIYDSGNESTIYFEDIRRDEVEFSNQGGRGLNIKVKGTQDSINIKQYYIYNDILLKFSDKTVLSGKNISLTVAGDDGDNDLYGYIGNDVLEGGKGNDTLNGGYGDDTYVYSKGDGNDTIVDMGGADVIKFGQGINKEDLVATKNGNEYYQDITLSFKNSPNDSIVIKEMLGYNTINANNKIEALEFANGEKLRIEDIKLNIIGSKENDDINGYKDFSNIIKGNEGDDRIYGGNIDDTIYGGDGNDRLYGNGGDDTLYGGEGNDIIEGGSGNDVYIYDKGDGKDTVYDANGTDTIKFGPGILKQDLIVKRNGYLNDFITISFKSSPNDSITILNVFADNVTKDSNIIETFEFENGERLSFEDIKKLSLIGSNENETLLGYNDSSNIIKGNGGDDRIYGGNINDTIYGGDGNDRLYGSGGDDTLYGNEGNDILEGGSGNDTLMGGKGNDILKGEEGDDIIEGGEGDDDINGYVGDDTLRGNEGDDKIYGGDGNDWLYGGDGNDILYGNEGDDTLMGQDGDDELNGQDGNDIIEGGSGNDTLYGGDGEDTYTFARGDGQDTIYADIKDTIKFKEGIKADDLMFEISRSQDSSSKDSILIRIKDTSDSILLMNTFEYGNIVGGIDKIVFHDGSSMNFNEIVKKTMIASSDNGVTINGLNTDDTIIGGKGDDILYGNKGNDAIYGGSGNDTLHGDAGDDILDGGAGDDRIEGGAGSDTYMFGRGSGKDIVENYDETSGRVDIIKIKNGVSRDDLLVKRVQIDGFDGLLLEIKDTDDSMIVDSLFYARDDYRKIDRIEFEDGSSPIELEEITRTAFNNNVILGDADGRHYYTRGNNSLIDLKQGNDYIEVDGKNVIYMFGKGDGQDTIFGRGGEKDRVDIIRFKEGVTKDDLIFQKPDPYGYGGTLIIKIKDTDDSIAITGDFLFNYNKQSLSRIEFSDGSFMDKEEIRNIMLNGTDIDDTIYSNEDNDVAYGRGGNDIMYGSGKNSILYGGDGDDKLYAQGKDITLYAEAGNDELYAESGGNNTLVGGAGDDTYFCYIPSTQDTVTIDNTGGGDDTLVLRGIVSSKDAKFSKDGNDLLIRGSYDDAGAIRVKNHFLRDDYAVNKIKIEYSGDSITQEGINKLTDIVYLSSQGGNNYLSDKDKKDNVYTYTGGKVTISDNGGDDRVVFKLDNSGDGLFYLSNGRDLKISTNKIDASNNDVLEIKNFFVNRSSIIENFDINDYWSVTAESIYEQYGKTFPPETPDNSTPSNPGGSDESSLTGGSEDNVFNYKGGMVSITDTGGNDKVIFKNPGSKVFYSSDGIDLMISTAKIDSSNNNILQVKNFFASKDSIIETFQINDNWSVTAQSIYKAFGKTYPNQTTPVNNNPTTPPNSDNLIGGKEDNVFTYTGDKKSITDTGGNDKVIFAKQGSKVFYSSDGVNLKISTAKINSSNKDVLEVKNFFSDKNAIIEEFQISDYWTVTAESIYQAFGKTYPTSTDTKNAPLALLGIPNNTSEAGLNDNNASDT